MREASTSELGGSAGRIGGASRDYRRLHADHQRRRPFLGVGPVSSTLPPPIPPPKVGGQNPGIVNGNGTTSILFKLTGLKVSDNQSPDAAGSRVFLVQLLRQPQRLGRPQNALADPELPEVYHELFGIEKTFLDGNASIGFRVPLNTISFKSDVAGLGGSSTAPGDLSVFLKYAFYRNAGNPVVDRAPGHRADRPGGVRRGQVLQLFPRYPDPAVRRLPVQPRPVLCPGVHLDQRARRCPRT